MARHPSDPPEVLVEKLLDGGPRQATDAYMALSTYVSQGVDLAPLLAHRKSKDSKRSYWIGNLVASSHRRLGRLAEWCAWLARCKDDRVTGGQLKLLGNSREDVRKFVPIAVEYLLDEATSSAVCSDALYFLSHLAERDPAAIDARAREVMESRGAPRAPRTKPPPAKPRSRK